MMSKKQKQVPETIKAKNPCSYDEGVKRIDKIIKKVSSKHECEKFVSFNDGKRYECDICGKILKVPSKEEGRGIPRESQSSDESTPKESFCEKASPKIWTAKEISYYVERKQHFTIDNLGNHKPLGEWEFISKDTYDNDIKDRDNDIAGLEKVVKAYQEMIKNSISKEDLKKVLDEIKRKALDKCSPSLDLDITKDCDGYTVKDLIEDYDFMVRRRLGLDG